MQPVFHHEIEQNPFSVISKNYFLCRNYNDDSFSSRPFSHFAKNINSNFDFSSFPHPLVSFEGIIIILPTAKAKIFALTSASKYALEDLCDIPPPEHPLLPPAYSYLTLQFLLKVLFLLSLSLAKRRSVILMIFLFRFLKFVLPTLHFALVNNFFSIYLFLPSPLIRGVCSFKLSQKRETPSTLKLRNYIFNLRFF